MMGVHGGVDALGAARFDFSTNSNACGPCQPAVVALKACDATRYPDPGYTALRQQLAVFHGVELWRVVLAASASEFVYRITAWAALHGAKKRGAAALTACVPLHAYGDYAQAAQAWGLAVLNPSATINKPAIKSAQDSALLVWACEPSSPLGTAHAHWPRHLLDAPVDAAQSSVVVLDRAYAPLRLSGSDALLPEALQRVWQLWTPNKALGLTGVRGAYAIAPADTSVSARAAVEALNALCPSWPVGAHGVAMLQSWVQPEVQTWLTQSHVTLRSWKERQIALLQRLGWVCLPSETNFFCAKPWGEAPDTESAQNAVLPLLRTKGIKLRDAASFGLPGHVRVSVQPPVAQDALARAWRARVPH